jgi:hypothetical protein
LADHSISSLSSSATIQRPFPNAISRPFWDEILAQLAPPSLDRRMVLDPAAIHCPFP